eukprot:6188297-Pleurochrysis_carterae.AAC.4
MLQRARERECARAQSARARERESARVLKMARERGSVKAGKREMQGTRSARGASASKSKQESERAREREAI